MPDNPLLHHGALAPGAIVVCDIDGVLSDASKRQHFLKRTPKDWEAFFAGCGDDPPIIATVNLLDDVAGDTGVVLLTSRPLHLQPVTVEWLARHDVRWDMLIMRPDGERRRSGHIKIEVVEGLVHMGFTVRLALDDDPYVVKQYVRAGVPALAVVSGYY